MSAGDGLAAVAMAYNAIKAIAEYIKDYKNAPEDLKDLETEVGLFENQLDQIQKARKNAALSGNSNFTAQLEKSKERFQDLERELDAWKETVMEKPHMKVLNPKKVTQFQKYLETARHLNQPLMDALVASYIGAKSVIDWEDIPRLKLDHFLEPQEIEKKCDTHTKAFESHCRGLKGSSPDWICSVAKFKTWLEDAESENPDENNSWLWLISEAGAGKSHLASYLMQHLRLKEQERKEHERRDQERKNKKRKDQERKDQARKKQKGKGKKGKDLEDNDQQDNDQEDNNQQDNDHGRRDQDHQVPRYGRAVFYCSWNPIGSLDDEVVLVCLLQQLLKQLELVEIYSKRFQDLFSKLKDGKMTVEQLFIEVCCHFPSSVIIVIDALDEYAVEADHCQVRHADELCAMFRSVQAKFKKPGSLRFFVTTRPRTERPTDPIIDKMENAKTIELYVQKELTAIRDKSTSFANAFRSFLSVQSRFELVTRKVLDASRQNFLCAKLQIDALRCAKNEPKIIRVLNNLRSSVDGLLEDARYRIKRSKHSTEGMLALLWAGYSGRPLTLPELKHGVWLSMRVQGPATIHERPSDIEDEELIRWTAYLLELESGSQHVRVHRSVGHCLKKLVQSEKSSTEKLSDIAHACLICLQPEQHKKLFASLSDDEDESGEYENHLFGYASEYWGLQVSFAFDSKQRFLEDSVKADDLRRLLFKMLDRSEFLALCSNVSVGDQASINSVDSSALPAFHILIKFNLHQDILDEWSRQGRIVKILSESGSTSLFFACSAKNENIALWLLKYHGEDFMGEEQSIICEAALKGMRKVVEWILEKEPKAVKQKSRAGLSTLLCAILSDEESSRTKIVEIILKKAASVGYLQYDLSASNPRSDYSWPLHEATRRGQKEVAELLLRYDGERRDGASSNIVNQHESRAFRDTPLHIAAHEGFVEMVEVLLKWGARTDKKQNQGKTPLHLVLQEFASPELEQVVVEDMESQDQRCKAIKEMRLIHLLLTPEACAISDNNGQSILHTAISRGSVQCLNTLGQVLDETTIQDLLRKLNFQNETPLVLSASSHTNGWRKRLKWCLDRPGFSPPECEAVSVWRAVQGQELDSNLVKRITHCIHGPFAMFKKGETPSLHKIVETGYLRLVEEAWTRRQLSETINNQDGNHERKTPLMVAVKCGGVQIVEFLLNNGALTTIRDNSGKTALHHAVESHQPHILRTLVAGVPNQKIEDHAGYTPIQRCSDENECLDILDPDGTLQARGSSPLESITNSKSTSNVGPGLTCWSITSGHWINQYGKPNKFKWLQTALSGELDWLTEKVPLELCREKYFTSLRIPARAKLPVYSIRVSIRGRKQSCEVRTQGMSTYSLAILRNDKIVFEEPFAANVDLSPKTQVHDQTWNIKEVIEDHSDSNSESNLGQPRELVKRLRLGDEIAVIAFARGRDWFNITQEATITINYQVKPM